MPPRSLQGTETSGDPASSKPPSYRDAVLSGTDAQGLSPDAVVAGNDGLSDETALAAALFESAGSSSQGRSTAGSSLNVGASSSEAAIQPQAEPVTRRRKNKRGGKSKRGTRSGCGTLDPQGGARDSGAGLDYSELHQLLERLESQEQARCEVGHLKGGLEGGAPEGCLDGGARREKRRSRKYRRKLRAQEQQEQPERRKDVKPKDGGGEEADVGGCRTATRGARAGESHAGEGGVASGGGLIAEEKLARPPHVRVACLVCGSRRAGRRRRAGAWRRRHRAAHPLAGRGAEAAKPSVGRRRFAGVTRLVSRPPLTGAISALCAAVSAPVRAGRKLLQSFFRAIRGAEPSPGPEDPAFDSDDADAPECRDGENGSECLRSRPPPPAPSMHAAKGAGRVTPQPRSRYPLPSPGTVPLLAHQPLAVFFFPARDPIPLPHVAYLAPRDTHSHPPWEK